MTWRKKDLVKGPLTPAHLKYREIGARDDSRIETKSKALLFSQLSSGLTNQVTGASHIL